MKEKIAAALYEAADIAAVIGNNIHTLHLNYKGEEFDTMHKKVLQQYYDNMDSDYDELAEWGECMYMPAPNKNDAAVRVAKIIVNFNEVRYVARDECINYCQEWLYIYANKLSQLNDTLDKVEDNIDRCLYLGITNWLQDRIQYWTKEIYYFNVSRRIKV